MESWRDGETLRKLFAHNPPLKNLHYVSPQRKTYAGYMLTLGQEAAGGDYKDRGDNKNKPKKGEPEKKESKE